MNALIQHVADQLQRPLDADRFLVVDAARLKRIVFLYTPGERDPGVVVRMPGHESTVKRCVAEDEGLRAFAELSLSGIRAPRPLGSFTWDGFECYLQEFVPSRPWLKAFPRYSALPKRNHLDTATELLIRIYKASATNDPDEVSDTRCFQHRDFFIGNIGWAGNTAVLYDFEFARPNGYPLYDMLHFALYYRIALRNRGRMRQNVAKGEYSVQQEERQFQLTADDIQHTLIEAGGFRDRVAEAVARYCSACGIDIDAAEKLIVHTVERAVENGRGVQGLPADWHRNLVNDLHKRLEQQS